MRKSVYYLLGFSAVLFLSNCANGQKLQKNPPAELQQAYYTTWRGDARGAGSGFNLFIPFSDKNNGTVEFDSVYFRGKSAVLQSLPNQPEMLVAYFRNESPKKAPDLIMSSDPKKEYGNKAPIIPKEIPFKLKEDEAVIVFKKDGQKSYFRIENIEKRDSGEPKIKNPENIQH